MVASLMTSLFLDSGKERRAAANAKKYIFGFKELLLPEPLCISAFVVQKTERKEEQEGK